MAEPRVRRRANVHRVLNTSKVLAGSYPRLLFPKDRFVTGTARCYKHPGKPTLRIRIATTKNLGANPTRDIKADFGTRNHVSADVNRVLNTSNRWSIYMYKFYSHAIAM